MEIILNNLGIYVKNLDAIVNALTTKVETLETTLTNAMKSINELDKGLPFLNSEVEELKKLEKDCTTPRQEILYMGVYQEEKTFVFMVLKEQRTRDMLIDFLQSELGIKDAFNRVHRIGRFNQQAAKPRKIIARFLRYSDSERVISNAGKFKGKNFGISADLPKESVDKIFCCKSAYFSRAEPDKLFIDGRLCST